jgi:hypothetical protein
MSVNIRIYHRTFCNTLNVLVLLSCASHDCDVNDMDFFKSMIN